MYSPGSIRTLHSDAIRESWSILGRFRYETILNGAIIDMMTSTTNEQSVDNSNDVIIPTRLLQPDSLVMTSKHHKRSDVSSSLPDLWNFQIRSRCPSFKLSAVQLLSTEQVNPSLEESRNNDLPVRTSAIKGSVRRDPREARIFKDAVKRCVADNREQIKTNEISSVMDPVKQEVIDYSLPTSSCVGEDSEALPRRYIHNHCDFDKRTTDSDYFAKSRHDQSSYCTRQQLYKNKSLHRISRDSRLRRRNSLKTRHRDRIISRKGCSNSVDLLQKPSKDSDIIKKDSVKKTGRNRDFETFNLDSGRLNYDYVSVLDQKEYTMLLNCPLTNLLSSIRRSSFKSKICTCKKCTTIAPKTRYATKSASSTASPKDDFSVSSTTSTFVFLCNGEQSANWVIVDDPESGCNSKKVTRKMLKVVCDGSQLNSRRVGNNDKDLAQKEHSDSVMKSTASFWMSFDKCKFMKIVERLTIDYISEGKLI